MTSQQPSPLLEVLAPISGYLALAAIVLLVVVGVQLAKFLARRKKHKTPHAPAATSVHVGSHPHGSDDAHHEHEKKGWFRTVLDFLLWLGIAAVIVLAIFWLGQAGLKEWQSNTTYSVGRANTARAIAMYGPPSESPSGSPAFNVPSPLTAPAQKDGWSRWVDVPLGTNIMSCEANDDLTCSDTESDVTKIGYAYQCKDRNGEVHNWSVEACRRYVAIRVKSKSDTALDLAYWYVPFGS